MSGFGIGELIWLIVAGFLGVGIVIAWIIKSEASRNFFKTEMRKLKAQLDAVSREKMMLLDEMNQMGASAGALAGSPADSAETHSAMIAQMIERTDQLEKENAKLIKELNEARSSLEEVYKALCSK